jgi:subtilisin family serine protease
MRERRLPRHRWALIGVLAGAMLVATANAAPATATPVTGAILQAGGATAVPNSYIVVFKNSLVSRAAVGSNAVNLAARYGGTVGHTYRHALRGFEVRLPESAARELAADPLVRYVEQNHTVQEAGTQKPTPSWGLDRIDQRNLPLDNSYTYPTTASNVNAYIIDSGIRVTHQDFGGRAVSGRDLVDNDDDASDCSGHGTHVAGTVGGNAHGVAKEVTLIGVRMLNCKGSGSLAGSIAAIDWVTADHDPGELAVANMSYGGAFSQAENDAVQTSIADGITYVAAAGNGNGNTCDLSPASAPDAITVGSTLDTDKRLTDNWGPCLDIFAPGSAITSAWFTSDTATESKWGTSMAAPHVAGAAALILTANPSFTPQQVRDTLIGHATKDVVTEIGPDSPNLLLHVDNSGPAVDDFAISVSSAGGATDPGGSLTATVTTAVTSGDPQPLTLSASGLPPGVTASFEPPSVVAGGSSTLTLSTSTATPHGTQPIKITGVNSSGRHSRPYALTVNGPPPCAVTNSTDIPIPDLKTVETTVEVSDCSGNASASSTVELHVVHPREGQLLVTLFAPDGTAYPLHHRFETDGTPNLDQTSTVNLSTKPRNGTWRLRIEDAGWLETGYVDSWTLTV